MDIQQIEGDAEARIRTHRMGDFRLRVVDAAGAPLPGARLNVRLVRHEFRLGANGFLIRTLSNGTLLGEYARTFAGLLNYATLPFYWGSYEAEPGGENEAKLRAMAAWCHDHGVSPKGHPLAWHEVFPSWAASMPDEETLRRLRERVERLVTTFRGVIDSWDVFNETTVATRFANAVGRWVKAQGAAACVEELLRLARAANPEAELLYNDFNVSPDMEALVGRLQERGAPFDAVGIQSHMHKGAWPAEKIWSTCETYARFGLPLHFTEVTLLSGRPKATDDDDWHRRHEDWITTPEGETRQLDEGRRFYTLLFSHPAVDAITWWDFSDRHAWQGAPAGLLRHDMSPKPLAEWLAKAFGETWSTRAETTTDANGVAVFRGFFGSYAVRAETAAGAGLAGSFRMSRRGAREAGVELK